MGFGRKQPQSYGVPVRTAVAPPLPPPPWQPAPAQPAGYYAPVAVPHAAPPMNPQVASYSPPQNSRPAANPYAPLAAQGSAYPGWAPAGPASAFPVFTPGKPRHKPSHIVAAVLIIGYVLIGGVSRGIERAADSRSNAPVTVPRSLGGLARIDDAVVRSENPALFAEFAARNEGMSWNIGVYSDDAGTSVISLVAVRGRWNERQEVSESQGTSTALDPNSRQTIGEASCYSGTSELVAACFIRGRISAVVIVFGDGDIANAAAIAAEAKRGLN